MASPPGSCPVITHLGSSLPLSTTINFPSQLSYHQTSDTVTQTAKLDNYFPKLSLQQCVAGINKTLVALVLWGMGVKGGLLDTVMSFLKQWT